ncbi:MAG: tryptophan 7-halogenase [Planctomycetes bacterium]|nr:tryptophan 7-halogenase [Planctomycetota bacterium]
MSPKRKTSKSATYDCVVIGGGPAGATAATLLADYGHRVVVLERGRFPRHHIGESLMPQSYWTFKRLGMLPKLKASDFPLKQSVQFVSPSGRDGQPYYFTERDPNEWSITWQVCRDRFDRMMLENAREHGAEVREGVGVKEVLFDDARAVGVRALCGDETLTIHAKVVIDASGASTLLSRQLGIRRPDPDLRNAAIYAYYKGAWRDEGRNAGATLVLHTPDRHGWFWSIPLPDDITSVGVVAPPAYLFTGRGDDPLATLEEEISQCPGIRRRLTGASRVSQAFVTSDFSYCASQLAGDGWVLIGDAFGFLDPVYSSGVFLALKTGEWAADAVHEALSAGEVTGARLGAFAPGLLRGMHLIRQLIHAFYDPSFSFREFHKLHPEYRDHIVRILIGDVFNDEVGQVFDVMRQWISLPEPVKLTGSIAQ